jgi:hypothetical protein
MAPSWGIRRLPGFFWRQYHSPTGPHSVNVHTLGDIDNQVDISVVVVIGATGNLKDLVNSNFGSAGSFGSTNLAVVVGHSDVIGIGIQVLGRGHDCELNGSLIAKSLVRPLTDRANFFHGRYTVVGDKDLYLERHISFWCRMQLPSPQGWGAGSTIEGVPTFVMTV